MPLSTKQKIMFLQEVKARKSILFGSFKEHKEGKKSKLEAWEEIKKLLDGYGNTHPYNYLRDAIWPNLRARSLSKYDKNKKTGAAPQEFDEIDELVLDILDKKSPVVSGIGVSEEVIVPAVPSSSVPTGCMERNFNGESFVSLLMNRNSSPEKPKTTQKRKHCPSKCSCDELTELRIKNVKLGNRKLELEILKLESDQGIPHVDI